MAYNPGQAPAFLDIDGLRKYVEEQLRVLSQTTATGDTSLSALSKDVLHVSLQTLTEAQKLQSISNLSAPFCCTQLRWVSATALQALPKDGDLLKIQGKVYRIPSTGIVGLANTGVFVNGVAGQNLAANTLYYVHVFNNAGVLTADFVTTARATSAVAGNVGVQTISGGNDSRSLIGMVYTSAGAQFNDNLTITWANRRVRQYRSVQFGPGTPGAYYQEVGGGSSPASPGLRVYYLLWSDEPDVYAMSSCNVSTTANTNVGCCASVNGTLVGVQAVPFCTNANNTLLYNGGNAPGTEGLNYSTTWGGSNAGSVTYSLAQTFATARG